MDIRRKAPRSLAHRLIAGCALVVLIAAPGSLAAQTTQMQQPAAAQPAAAAAPPAISGCDVSGRALSSSVPLPGVVISASNSLTGKKAATSTEVDGTYKLAVPSNGRYVVRAELAGFAPATKEVIVNAANCHVTADLDVMLLSRARAQEQREQQAQQIATAIGGTNGNGNAAGARAAGRGFQNLPLSADPSALGAAGENGNSGMGDAAAAGLPSQALNPETSSESVAVSGNNAQSFENMFGGNNEELRQRIEDMRERARNGEFAGGGPQMIMIGPGGGGPMMMGGGGDRGFGGGPGGFGGGQIIRLGGRNGRFNINQPHGSLFYSASDGIFDAKPYSLTGQPTAKPDYLQQRFGATLGGPLNIQHIYKGGTKTFFFANYTGNRSTNPYDVFSTVPTPAERSGDFSQTLVRSGPNTGQAVQLFDPVTHLAIANNRITNINSAAAGLLPFIPLPNLPGTSQNFHYVTSTTASNDNLSFRLIHNFGNTGPGMFGTGGGGRGGRGGGNRNRNNLNFGLSWRRSDVDQTTPFPTAGGHSKSSNWDLPVGWIFGRGHLTNNLHLDYNRSHTDTTNLYAFLQNIEGTAGIAGVSQNPFDWGLPGLSFTNFTGLSDITPVQRHDQTWSISDFVFWNHNKHNLRFGGDFRRIYLNTHTDKNARGNYTFTGLYTAQVVNGVPITGTGLDFADFLLGFAQQASIQFGATDYHFRANSWDLFIQDDWRVRGNLTINVGLRYEYVSPYTETSNQIVNLDATPTFTAVAPVLPGQTGPFTGAFPATLVDPDRNNFAPRIGIAWKPMAKTVVRAGYGLNYNTTQYANIVQNLAFQPPFSFTQTNVGTVASPLLLQNAFPTVLPNTTTNNYGVDRNYRLGYVQIWNLDVQRELTRSLMLNIGYTGTKGTRLDMLRAPNRTPTGLRIAGVQPFLWESSVGDSVMHAGNIRLRKRMANGISIGGSYTYSKSIDNASSIGGAGTLVAQNDLDLAAERGLSSFDQRHRLSLDYVYDFPFGQNRRFLATNSVWSHLLGNWEWSGGFTLASGRPFTPRVIGAFTDVAGGTNGTLRADVTGQPVSIDDRSVLHWFNTAAFMAPPAGPFGDAQRNSIIGPTTTSFNMALSKNIIMGDSKGLELRVQASNVFNTPQFTAIDTTVNSRTYGQVISAGSMRKLSMSARFRF